MPLPADLTGKRVLDIGAWDGWCAFEAERRGASVVAVDCVEQETFHWLHRKLGSRISYQIAEVYELRDLPLGRFDYTLFLGVLYHLRHPLLGLDIVCELTTDIAIIDSFIVDDDPRAVIDSPIPWMEFYENRELANSIDNWHGPTLQCLLALCRAAGFARVELLNVQYKHARVACYRRWEPPPAHPTAPAPSLRAVANGRFGDYGINFRSRKEEFLACWFSTAQPGLTWDSLRLEVSGYGVPALCLDDEGEGVLLANFRLPPGLEPGWHDVRLRTAGSPFSNPCRIAVDLPAKTDSVKILSASDAVTWRENEVEMRAADSQGHLALWVDGVSEVADRRNIRVYCDGFPLAVDFVSEPNGSTVRQVNVRLGKYIEEGPQKIHVEFGGAKSEPVQIAVHRATGSVTV